MTNNINTFQFMLENRKVIIEKINENGSVPKAWDQLRKKLPEGVKIIKYNTFKGYVKSLNVINNILNEKDEFLRTMQKLSEEVEKIRQEKNELEIKLVRLGKIIRRI